MEQSSASRNLLGDLIDVEEVAEILGVSTKWVYQHTRDLPTLRIGKRILRFHRAEIEAWLADRREVPA